MNSNAPVALIFVAAGTEREVEIQVSRCLYTCCGGGWTVREPEPPATCQVYRGKVLAGITEDSFVLRSAPLGKITSVLVEFNHLVDARFIREEDSE